MDKQALDNAIAQLQRAPQWRRITQLLLAEYNEDKPNHEAAQKYIVDGLAVSIRKASESLAQMKKATKL